MQALDQHKWSNHFGWIIIGLGALFYLPFLGSVHLFDWDEINFAESSREMLITGDYFRVTVDYRPFWEKPPLFFWLQAICMKIFGVNELAARLPNALFGILTLFTLFKTGKRINGPGFGFIWAFIYLISFLPFFYFKSGIIDPVFNYFIFTSLQFFIRSVNAEERKRKISFAFLSGLLNGLAILTKGPVGFLIAALCILTILLSSRFKIKISFISVLLFVSGAILSSSIWYLPELINNGGWFMREFILYQVELFTKPVAGHQQPFYYHFLVVFIGCFPLSIFALPELVKRNKELPLFDYKKWMLALFWVVMILFTIVSTKIVHYSSMAYLPLSFLAARYISNTVTQNRPLKTWSLILIGFFGTIFSLALLCIPYFFMHKDIFLPLVKDPFAVASIQQNECWSITDYSYGLIFLGTVVFLLVNLRKNKTLKGLLIYGLVSISVLLLYLKMIVPRVEKYVQKDLIEFYESMQGKDVHIISVGFKTYAILFYFRQPERYREADDKKYHDALIYGPIDKPVYIVVKNTEKYVPMIQDVQLVNTLGGYKVYRRDP